MRTSPQSPNLPGFLFINNQISGRQVIRVLVGVTLVGVALSIALMMARIYFAVSFEQPLQGQTSGWEQGVIYVVWRVVHGHEIYMDRFSYPFAEAGYNWLFYTAYGVITKGVMVLLSLEDSWIPTISRFITLFGIFLGVFVTYRSFVTALNVRDSNFKILCAGFAAFIFTGPLIGFSAFTVRPDTWALLFEIAAIWLFWLSWRRFGRLPVSTVIGIAALVIVAWSFKQMYVFALGGIGLFLLFKRQFKSLVILSSINISYWALIFSLGGPIYIETILLVDVPMTFTIGHAWDVFVNFATKSSPGLAGGAVLLVLGAANPHIRRTMLANEPLLFAAAGLLVSTIMVFTLSSQDGSSEIYYFSVSYFLLFTTLAGFYALRSDPVSKWISMTFIAGWVGVIIAIFIVFTGYRGVISVRPYHQNLIEAQQCLERLDLSKPIYIQNAFLSLPWMVAGAEPFVVSYFYYRERAMRSERFEHGGIGGLIKKGYFASIVLMGESLPEKVDGEAISGYTPSKKSCPGMLVLSRNTT